MCCVALKVRGVTMELKRRRWGRGGDQREIRGSQIKSRSLFLPAILGTVFSSKVQIAFPCDDPHRWDRQDAKTDQEFNLTGRVDTEHKQGTVLRRGRIHIPAQLAVLGEVQER